MNVYLRLLEFARPYRGRFTIAVLAMLVYGAASVGVVRQVKPILDEVLPRGERLATTIGAPESSSMKPMRSAG